MRKLYLAEVPPIIMRWILSFLTDREQRVIVAGTTSCWKPVTSGVPQGSVLGPTLFLTFINDLPDDIKHSFLNMFADDSKMSKRVDNITEASPDLQKDINNAIAWGNENSIDFNAKKFEVIHFGKRKTIRFQYTANGQPIPEKSSVRDLGVLINNELSFGGQCSSAVSKASRIMSMLKRTFSHFTVKSLTVLFRTYILPILEYCAPIWAPYHQKDICRLENVQRKASKLVGSIRSLPYPKRLKMLGLTSLAERRLKLDLTETFKFISGHYGPEGRNLFDVDYNCRNAPRIKKNVFELISEKTFSQTEL